MPRLLAVDPSLTCSGWALFRIDNGELEDVGKIRALPPSRPLAERLSELQGRICELLGQLGLCFGDLLVCESPTTMRDPRAAFKVEQVRGIFETLAREREVNVPGRINPRSVHREMLGLKGKQLPRPVVKAAATQVAQMLYGQTLGQLGVSCGAADQDIMDAVLLGGLAVSWIRNSLQAGLPVDASFLMQQHKTFGSRIRW